MTPKVVAADRPCHRNEQPSTCLQPLEALEIIRNPAVQVVLRRVTEFGARAQNLIDAESDRGHGEKIEPGPDLDNSVRQTVAARARQSGEGGPRGSAHRVP